MTARHRVRETSRLFVFKTMKHHLGVLTLLLASHLATGADVPPPDKLLPADILGVLTIPEYAKSRTAFNQASLVQLWNDPSMKAFREKFTGKFSSTVVAPLEKEFGIKFSDYSGLAQGQVSLAISANGPKNPEGEPDLGVVLLVDARNQSAQLQTNLTALRK